MVTVAEIVAGVMLLGILSGRAQIESGASKDDLSHRKRIKSGIE
jgi:hypothetical protein